MRTVQMTDMKRISLDTDLYDMFQCDTTQAKKKIPPAAPGMRIRPTLKLASLADMPKMN
jgi:hypothetical protein